MPIYMLSEALLFPPPELASESGLLAVGGDLSPQRLLAAYRKGIFPWYSEQDPILWWSPDPRMVLYPSRFHVSRSMRRIINKAIFKVTMDTQFDTIIENCARIRIANGEGTWITAEMERAYKRLYRMGFAHSVETWQEGEIVGGLYGVSLGGCFFGESMYSIRPNASKIALYHLARFLEIHGFAFIDCQVYSEHMQRLGACQIPRQRFMRQLQVAIQKQTLKGDWNRFNEKMPKV